MPGSATPDPLPEPTPTTAALAIAMGAGIAAILNVLYTRLAGKSEALANERRQRIMKILQARPGIRLRDLAAEMSIRRTAVVHHLRILEAWGIVKIDSRRRAVHVYLATQPLPAAPSGVILNPVCRRLLAHLRARGGVASRAEIHAALADVPERTRNYNVRRLLAVGLIAEDDGSIRVRA